ncbi:MULTISPECIES: alkyl/aryl-sulfatase [Spirulina sp. CCY15215]|uniref:alkyl/aryl-sulfatase n=1 Tax=Spirulina sp. CCY15215 TaxID=2767591 RepID=UPI00195106B7|nr:alkyl/aryl-sulfatase [Spirulina major]
MSYKLACNLACHAIANIFKILGLLGLLFFLNSSSILADNLGNLHQECQPKIIEVTSGVYVAVGNTRAHITLIEGDNGVIIVDTGDNIAAAERVITQFQNITQKPIAAIIYTHSHYDHTGGTRAFLNGDRTPIYARANFQAGGVKDNKLEPIDRDRTSFQHGTFIDPKEIIAVNKTWCKLPIKNGGDGFVPPNHRFTQERVSLNIAGIALELVAAPGETDDQLYVWLPDKKVLLCGDNYYRAFPNLYSIRGSYRDVKQWVHSLDKIIGEAPEYLISGHSLPITGEEKIKRIITDYRDGIDSIFEQTLTGMGRGLTPEELVAVVKLPPELATKPYLQENYGNIPWTVRGIYNHYLGWFDGNPTHLFPLSTRENATRISRLVGGKEKLWQVAQNAFTAEDYQWTLELTDYLLALGFQTGAVKELKAETLKSLAQKETNGNAKHYYLSIAQKLQHHSKILLND